MPEVVDLKTIARKLLADGEVEAVLGYEPGSRPLTATPLTATDPADCDRLLFDRTCEYNLANYLHGFAGRRVAIIAKGCDERSIVGLLQERQIRREDVVILGAPCDGLIDRRRVAAAVGTESIQDASLDGQTLSVTVRASASQPDAASSAPSDAGILPASPEVILPSESAETAAKMTATLVTHTLDLDDVCFPGFREDPRFADYLIAEPTGAGRDPADDERLAALEADTADARWAKFSAEMDKCILCFACRNVCPACYCSRCFADQTNPKWMSKTDDPADAAFFHMTRYQHLAGRCTGCGACVRACPVGVDLKLYNDKLHKDVAELFEGFEAGLDPETPAPLGCYKADDYNEIFK